MTSTSGNRPRISLVTPNFNGEAFLKHTFESVAQQEFDGLEYILIDGASSDRSMAIAEQFSDLISTKISEPDAGHADAINKGFASSSGEIMGWINSDDVLLPGCLDTVARVFETFPNIEWITGRASTINENSELTDVRPARPWSRRRFLGGDHLWIQQESTFWRRDLWERAGARLDTDFDVANDFELWARFFRLAELYTIDRMLGCFRVRDGQRSKTYRALYFDEVNQILRRELRELDSETHTRLSITPADQPVRLSTHQLRSQDRLLAVDDPPIVTSASLREGRLGQASVVAAILEDSIIQDQAGDADVTGWIKTVLRNWRFLAGFGVAYLLCALAGLWLSVSTATLITSGLIALSLLSTVALAIKVRRIVMRLEQSVERALGGRARAELRNQLLEQQFDALNATIATDQKSRR